MSITTSDNSRQWHLLFHLMKHRHTYKIARMICFPVFHSHTWLLYTITVLSFCSYTLFSLSCVFVFQTSNIHLVMIYCYLFYVHCSLWRIQYHSHILLTVTLWNIKLKSDVSQVVYYTTNWDKHRQRGRITCEERKRGYVCILCSFNLNGMLLANVITGFCYQPTELAMAPAGYSHTW